MRIILLLLSGAMLTQGLLKQYNNHCHVTYNSNINDQKYGGSAYNLVCLNINNMSSIKIDSNMCSNYRCTNITFAACNIPTLSAFGANNVNLAWSRRIFLNDCNMKIIENGAFDKFNEIKEIHLQDNILGHISRGNFEKLGKLTVLNLQFNVIDAIQEESFYGLVELRHLYLGHNKISQISNTLFIRLINLQELDISFNFIKSISGKMFTHALEIIRANNNKLETIQFDGHSFNSKLRLLNISSNYLTDLHDLQTMNSISILDATNNFMHDLPNLMELKELYIGNNSIINVSSLKRIPQLKILDINSNGIHSLPRDSFRFTKYLQSLNISGNNLEILEFGLFNGLEQLHILDFSNNNLTTLDADSLFSLKNLRTLNLSNNKLKFIMMEKIFKNCPHLQNISFTGNEMPCSLVLSILHLLGTNHVYLPYGNAEDTTNVHGISCVYVQQNVSNKMQNTNNQDPKISKEFFNEDQLKNFTNFFNDKIEIIKKYYKGLEKIEESVGTSLNNDFMNASLFKFFERLNSQLNISKIVSNAELEILHKELINERKELKDAKDLWRNLNTSYLNGPFHQFVSNLTNLKTIYNVDYNNTKLINDTLNLLVTKLQNYTKSEIEIEALPLTSPNKNAISAGISNEAEDITHQIMKTNTIIVVFGSLSMVVFIILKIQKHLFKYATSKINGGFTSSELQL